jgi:hypothetical protein
MVSSPSRSTRPHRGIAPLHVAIAVALVAAIVAGSLFAAGVVKVGSHGSSSAPSTYAVTFSETGLTAGTNWSVTLGTATHASTSSTVTFSEGDGDYDFSINPVPGYTVSGTSGTLLVAGAPVSSTLTFYVSYALAMSAPSWSSTNPDYGSIAINAVSGGLTTALFGLTISTESGAPVAIGTAVPATCAWSKSGTAFSTTNCGAPTGNWYVVLFYTGNGSIADVYVNGAWASGTPTVSISAAETVEVIGSQSLLQASGDTLSAFGTSSSSVSGSSGLF